MSARRVLHVIEAMHRGGAESLVIEHVRHSGHDFEPVVCALNRGGPALDTARALGARTYVLEKGKARLAGVRRLVELMRAERAEVVNGHNPAGGFYAALAGRIAGARVVVRTEHSVHYPGRHGGTWGGVLEPLSTAMAHRVVCVCEAVRESHVRRLGWAAKRFVTVPNGISAAPGAPAREAVRASLGVGAADRVVLSVGSLTRQKAQHLLIEAFARVAPALPSALLLIAGEGPLRGDLEQRARESRSGARIRFLGPRGDVHELMLAADVFALSSVREGLSVTLLEAMRAACPVVATDAGGNREAIAHDETGLVVPAGEPIALAAAIHSLLAEPSRAAAFGAAGRRRWARLFTAERMVSETEGLYRDLLAARSAPPRATHRRPSGAGPPDSLVRLPGKRAAETTREETR